MVAKKKKGRSAKQLANDRRLKKLAKEGKLFGTNRRKSSKKKVVRGKRTSAKQPRKNPVKRKTGVSDINKELLLKDIGKTGISRKNKMKIINAIAKRLKV